jgi:hypothetical protein
MGGTARASWCSTPTQPRRERSHTMKKPLLLSILVASLTPRAPRVLPPRRAPALHAAAFIASFHHHAPPRAPRGRCPRVLPPRPSPRSTRPLPTRSSTASRSTTSWPVAIRAFLHHAALRAAVAPVCGGSSCIISACDGTARDPCKRLACVATAWDAEALATSRAGWVASAWVAWRDGRMGRMGISREHSSERRRGGSRGTRPCVSGGNDVVAGRGDLIRGGRGREGGGSDDGAGRGDLIRRGRGREGRGLERREAVEF